MEQELKETLDKLHAAQEQEDLRPIVYKVGQKVWVLRPGQNWSKKTKSWWCGPCEVKQRLGDHTYLVQVSAGHARECHVNQMKQHHADVEGKSWPLFF